MTPAPNKAERHPAISSARELPAMAASTKTVDPWEVLTQEEKIDRLRRLLEENLAVEIPRLLATP